MSNKTTLEISKTEIDSDTRDLITRGYRQGMCSQRLNRVNIKHKFSSNDIKIPGLGSVGESGPPSPASGQIPNFGEVAPGIHRSSFPFAVNLEHLKSLNLKTILTLVKPEFDPPEVMAFMKESGIQHRRILIPNIRKSLGIVPIMNTAQVLKILLDVSSHPVLIHCNKGKHRTGVMIGCYRKINGWSMSDILLEYHEYADEKARAEDEGFMSAFDTERALDAIKELEEGGISANDDILPTPPISPRLAAEPIKVVGFEPVFSKNASPSQTPNSVYKQLQLTPPRT